ACAEGDSMLPEPQFVSGNLSQLGIGGVGETRAGVDGVRKRRVQRFRPARLGESAEEPLVAGEFRRLRPIGGKRVSATLNFEGLLNVEAVRPRDLVGRADVGDVRIDQHKALQFGRIEIGERSHIRRAKCVADEHEWAGDPERAQRVVKLGRDPFAGARHRTGRAETVTRPVEAARSSPFGDLRLDHGPGGRPVLMSGIEHHRRRTAARAIEIEPRAIGLNELPGPQVDVVARSARRRGRERGCREDSDEFDCPAAAHRLSNPVRRTEYTRAAFVRSIKSTEAALRILQRWFRLRAAKRRPAMFHGSLRAFDETVRAGSIRKASSALGVAPSSVSRHIAILERQIGTALFERHSDGVELTHAGALAAEFVRRLLIDYDSLRTDLDDLRGVQRRLVRLAAVESIAATSPMSAVHKFNTRYPAVSFNIRLMPSPAVAQSVRDGQCEIGLAYCVPADAEILPLARIPEPVMLAVRSDHPLAGSSEIRPEQVAGIPLALPDADFGVRQIVDAAAGRLGMRLEP